MFRPLALATLLLTGFASAPAAAQVVPEVDVTRLDCGRNYANQLNMFSDTMAYPGQTKVLVGSCYLVRHGDELMLWDAGNPDSARGRPNDPSQANVGTLAETIAEQLARLGLTPSAIRRVGISHLHGDHTGQLPTFAGATLLIGEGDWALVSAAETDPRVNTKPFAAWMAPDARRQTPAGDLDVFGDGTVVMLALPGHTPGHHALLVRRTDGAPVLLAGDQAHFTENLETRGVPTFNTDRADTLASFDRMARLAENLGATIVLGHEPSHIGLLPSVEDRAK